MKSYLVSYRIQARTLPLIFAGLLFFSVPLLNGCGVLIGNTRPVSEKSQQYQIEQLHLKNPDWSKLDSKAKQPGADEAASEPTEYSDLAFRSKKTEAVIALNSACRPSYATHPKDLKLLAEQLFMGISDVTENTEVPLQIGDVPALQKTLQGRLGRSKIKMRVIVLRKETCLYDLMYLSHPDQFPLQEEEFSHFVASLRFQ